MLKHEISSRISRNQDKINTYAICRTILFIRKNYSKIAFCIAGIVIIIRENSIVITSRYLLLCEMRGICTITTEFARCCSISSQIVECPVISLIIENGGKVTPVPEDM